MKKFLNHPLVRRVVKRLNRYEYFRTVIVIDIPVIGSSHHHDKISVINGRVSEKKFLRFDLWKEKWQVYYPVLIICTPFSSRSKEKYDLSRFEWVELDDKYQHFINEERKRETFCPSLIFNHEDMFKNKRFTTAA